MDDVIMLESKDLVLRLPEKSDKNDLEEIYSDIETMASYGMPTLDELGVENLIPSKRDSFRKKNELYLVIVLKENLKTIGFVTLNYRQYVWQIEFAINKKYRNMGYTYQALSELFKFCKHNGVEKISAKVQAFNVASKKLLEKFDFKTSGITSFSLYNNNILGFCFEKYL